MVPPSICVFISHIPAWYSPSTSTSTSRGPESLRIPKHPIYYVLMAALIRGHIFSFGKHSLTNICMCIRTGGLRSGGPTVEYVGRHCRQRFWPWHHQCFVAYFHMWKTRAITEICTRFISTYPRLWANGNIEHAPSRFVLFRFDPAIFMDLDANTVSLQSLFTQPGLGANIFQWCAADFR